jgi:hypothetical protein
MNRIFCIDLRSIALTRILIASIILCDLFTRSLFLTIFYTDSGALPRKALMFIYAYHNPLSLHMAFGSIIGESILFLLAAFFALNLLIGHKTRLFTILLFFFMISLNNRNPFILNNGDKYLTMILFLGIFLPWGEKFCLKHPKTGPGENLPAAFTSLASVAFILQVICVYTFSGLLKLHSPWWTSGKALFFAASMKEISNPLAHSLLHYPNLLEHLSKAMPYAEIFIPLLFLIPLLSHTPRFIAVLFLIFFHIGSALVFNIGYFPAICISALVGLIPSSIWDRNEPDFPAHFKTNALSTICLLFFLSQCLATNLQSIDIKIPCLSLPRSWGALKCFDQQWPMFTDLPKSSSLFSVEYNLNDGTSINEALPKEERMRKFASFIKNRKILGNYWGNYYCEQWNNNILPKKKRLKNVRLIQTVIPTLADGSVVTDKKYVSFNYNCR